MFAQQPSGAYNVMVNFPIAEGAMRLTNRLGERYGRLVVIDRAPNKGERDTNARWVCQCDCGNKAVVYGQDLKRGRVVSCGCWNTEKRVKHGMSRSNVYRVWQQMHQRCTNPDSQAFHNYGGRGISVCARWNSFENFVLDMGARPKGFSIERIDNNLGYEPGNCRWATTKEQTNNQRRNRVFELNGKRKTIAGWADELGIDWHTLRSRIDRYGWTVERALTTPVKHKEK